MREDQLHKLAGSNGIQTFYVDDRGNRREISSQSVQEVLKILGTDLSQVNGRSAAPPQPKFRAEPVTVCWDGKAGAFPLLLPESANSRNTRLLLKLEDGSKQEVPFKRLHKAKRVAPRNSGSLWWNLPLPSLPLGYHWIELQHEQELRRVFVISARRKLYSPPHLDRQWGVFLPLYALHSEQTWGAGNFSDWKRLSTWISDLGGSVMASLPLLSTFLEHPIVEPSPYSPATRLFWNEFFLDVTAVPNFHSSRAAQRLLAAPKTRKLLAQFRRSEFVDYSGEWQLKRQVLEILAREFLASGGNQKMRSFVKARPEVKEYAVFRALCEQQETSWQNWPERLQRGKVRKNDYPEQTRDFYLFAQWAAQQQMDDLLQTAKKEDLALYLDLPLGVNPDSFDAWRYRDFFACGASAGAPPDSFFTKGQDWGFAPLHPKRCRELHYEYVIDYLRFQMRHTGMLRIDHVMGLHRLYWVPHGFPASEGAYVTYPAEELYAILSVESHRYETMLVGENLGTVPPEVNQSMKRHGVRQMYVFQYEQGGDGVVRPPGQDVVASVNTHDMPTFAAHFSGADIADRQDLGLLTPQEARAARKLRKQMMQKLVAALRKLRLLNSRRPGAAQVHLAIARWLGTSDAETVLLNLEDFWAETQPQNTPGTSRERPNWRRKTKFTLEQMQANAEIRAALQEIHRARSQM